MSSAQSAPRVMAPPRRVAVYTAVFGGYDVLPPVRVSSERCDFICFTDDAALGSGGWRMVHLPPTLPPALMNRHVKLHPHLYLPDHEVSVYVDANLELRRDPADLVERYLGDGLFAAPRHPKRRCVYEELEACVAAGKIDAAAARAQAERYRREGYPAGNGLTENRVLVRRHQDPSVRALMEAWWTELVSGVRRDQACLQVVCWRQAFTVSPMAEDCTYGAYFRYRPHRHAPLVFRAKLAALIALKRLARARPPARPTARDLASR